jgi:hypothetical protein
MFRVKFALADDCDLAVHITDDGKGKFRLWACGDCRTLFGGYDGNHVVAITLSPLADGTTDIVLVHQWTNHTCWVSQALLPAPPNPGDTNWQLLAMTNWVNLTLAEVETRAGMPK